MRRILQDCPALPDLRPEPHLSRIYRVAPPCPGVAAASSASELRRCGPRGGRPRQHPPHSGHGTPPRPDSTRQGPHHTTMEGLAAGLHDGLSLHDLQPPSLTHDPSHTPTHTHDHTHTSHDHTHTHALTHRHDTLHPLDVAHAHSLQHAHTSSHVTPTTHATLASPHQTGVAALRGPPPLHPLTPTPSTTVLPPTPTDKKPPTLGK